MEMMSGIVPKFKIYTTFPCKMIIRPERHKEQRAQHSINASCSSSGNHAKVHLFLSMMISSRAPDEGDKMS